MKDTPPHLQALEEIEKAGIPGLLEVLREEGVDGVRYTLWDATGWHRDYSPPVLRLRHAVSAVQQAGSRQGHLVTGRLRLVHPSLLMAFRHRARLSAVARTTASRRLR